MKANGTVIVATGIGTQGQGHFTSFAQIVADAVGVHVTDVDVVTGDTDQFYWGAGTFASRGAVVAGNAISAAAQAVREKILRVAAEHFECAEQDLEIADGRVAIAGVRAERAARRGSRSRPTRCVGREPGTGPTSRRRATSPPRAACTP